jgi:hypothetical protein
VFEERIQNSAGTYEAEILDAGMNPYTHMKVHTQSETQTHKLSCIPNDKLELARLNRRQNERNVNITEFNYTKGG